MIGVTNSVALIMLGKIPELLLLLKERYRHIFVPDGVYNEVVEKGKKLGKPSVLLIEKKFEEGFFRRKSINDETVKTLLAAGLGKGEAEAIALAKKENVKEILIDEKAGRKFATRLGLETLPLPALIISAYRNKHINKEKAKKLLAELLASNYRISTDIYNKIIGMLEE